MKSPRHHQPIENSEHAFVLVDRVVFRLFSSSFILYLHVREVGWYDKNVTLQRDVVVTVLADSHSIVFNIAPFVALHQHPMIGPIGRYRRTKKQTDKNDILFWTFIFQSHHTNRRLAATCRKLGTEHRLSVRLGESHWWKRSNILYQVCVLLIQIYFIVIMVERVWKGVRSPSEQSSPNTWHRMRFGVWCVCGSFVFFRSIDDWWHLVVAVPHPK